MRQRKSNAFMLYLVLNLTILAILFLHAHICSKAGAAMLKDERHLVEVYRLTDICLFTDARYTRNPSMADIHSSFQDSPMSLDYFPSGALMLPPPHLTRYDLD